MCCDRPLVSLDGSMEGIPFAAHLSDALATNVVIGTRAGAVDRVVVNTVKGHWAQGGGVSGRAPHAALGRAEPAGAWHQPASHTRSEKRVGACASTAPRGHVVTGRQDCVT